MLDRLRDLIRAELAHLTTFNPSERRWEMPLAAALANGLPLMVGAWFGHLEYGLVSALGATTLLHLPPTPMHHRMVLLMTVGFGLVGCYTLGVISHFVAPLMMVALAVIAILATMVTRYYRLGPPGSLFFVMAAAIGAYAPVEVPEVPLHVGLFVMGSLLAVLIGFVHSLHVLARRPAAPPPPLPPASFDFVVFDSIVIGAFVGLSLAVSQLLGLDRPYWVPISCLAVIQGVSLRAVWIRQLHRILGTALGLGLAWLVLRLPLGGWTIAPVMMGLSFVIEFLVVRHYALAVIFITPFTILLADAAQLGMAAPEALIVARLWDIVLGSLMGLAGGACLHSPRFRATVGGAIRRLFPF
jgi:hypothetical protein